ncbi:Protein F41E6.12 [Aphelenchoides avenae]|nr:Protein F41E6.12 [Aphelenchus avenae]
MTVKTICVALILSVLTHQVNAERSKLVEIACKRNPALSFCKDDETIAADKTSTTSESLPELPTTTATTNDSASSHTKDQWPEKKEEQEHSSEEEDESTTMRPRRKKTRRKSRRRHDSSESEEERPKRPRRRKHRRESSVESEEERPRPPRRRPKSKPKRRSSEEAFIRPSKSDRSDEEVPDDPVLDEPVPSQSSPAVPKEHLGSLLRLPRPVVTSRTPSGMAQKNKDGESDESLISPPALPRRRVATNEPEESRELLSSQRQEKTDPKIAVFVTKFCVLERQRFIDKCRGEVNPKDVPFCKQYPLSCKAIDGVIPVIAYCDRYQRHYGKYCFADSRARRTRTIKEFCKAFDQFCDNPAATMTAPAKQAEPRSTVDEEKPSSQAPGRTLRRCKDVVDEARRVCHPPPPADDEFNTRRCQAFLKSCASYVDWLKPVS